MPAQHIRRYPFSGQRKKKGKRKEKEKKKKRKRVQCTGVKSLPLRPSIPSLASSAFRACLPSMSTTMTNLTPVLSSQPYMAMRSSRACSRPKSWPIALVGMRASKMSRHELSIIWYSSWSLSAAYWDSVEPVAGKRAI